MLLVAGLAGLLLHTKLCSDVCVLVGDWELQRTIQARYTVVATVMC